eukprot:TRINITY_DN1802_c0_g1_i1.p1 TRINITY_DN1802_c0_g1~~TRINITY_DN1802_c0_g1_i1.p1  ORF type:complete len:136 (+),score=27.45 TRINITY_DN1802_c0_g1_i1:60-467(+)
MPKALKRESIVKKRTKKFRRFQSDNFKRVPTPWRRPKGIDSRVRRRFRSVLPMPDIGYGSNKRTRDLLPNHFYKFIVHNVKELEVLLMQNKTYAAQIAHNVSAKKRITIVNRAKQLNILVLNAKARVRKEEAEAK